MILTAWSVKSEENGSETVRTRLVGRHNDFFVPGLYKNELRRTWSVGLLYAIILFFAIPVITLLMYSNNVEYYTQNPERMMRFLTDYFNNTNIFVTIYACLGGMMSAMVVGEYLFDRRKTNFICSLPIKRHAYLVTKASTNLTWSVLAWIPAMLLTVIVSLLTPLIRPYFTTVVGGLFAMFGAWLCGHLYFFGISLLALAFCGTGVMAGCMVLMLGGYVPVLALSLVGFADITFSHVWTSWYLSEDLFSAISGVFRIFRYSMTEMGILYYLGTALLGLLFIVLAVLLVVKRRSEMAGTPFAFDRVRDTVKTLLICLAGLLGGMLFHVMSDGGWSIFWMLFGIICGAVLAWMLCNTIFYKTPKMMFTGKRGVAIITAIMMVFSLGFRFDLLNIDNYVPSNTMTRSVELKIGNLNMEIRDRSLVRLYNAMMKNGYATYNRYGEMAVGGSSYYTESYYGEERIRVPNMTGLNTVWHTRYLVPVAKRSYALQEDWAAFVTALTAQNDFADMFLAEAFEALEEAERGREEGIYSRLYYRDQLKDNRTEMSGSLSTKQIRSVLEAYLEELRAKGADSMQQQYIGTMNFRFENIYLSVPMYECYTETNTLLQKYLREYGSVDDSGYQRDREFVSADVRKNGELIKTLDEASLLALYEDGVLIWGVYEVADYNTPLTLVDPDYSVTVNYRVSEGYYEYTYYDEYGDVKATEVYDPASTEKYDETVICGFFLGKVPETFSEK